MLQMLGANIVDGITTFLGDMLENIGVDYLLYIFGGIMLFFILVSGIRLIWCYEDRTMRTIKRINKYLKNNPKINDDNLVEFHKKMKKLPRRIRDRWQLFMLEREGSPSRYMTVEYCVKRPLYNSAILMNQKQIGYATVIIAVLSFLFSLASIVKAGEITNVGAILLQASIVPAVVGVLGSIYCMILHLRYNSINHDFYDMFTNFVRNIDKATNTMPDYVDYELLFTKKEIEKGIPVLREYLEKRAMEEQRLLEKAKREDVNHSPYDFSSLGVNGAQLIERAVSESEKFLINKINTQNEITDLEKQLQKTDANMEDIERDANRKLQAIKENLERLDKAMSETTNRVEINYNRRQSDAEMNKKLLLEKDLQTMLDKEKVAANALKVEIQKRKEDIEENKKAVEDALKSEYDTFATKVYNELSEKITRDNSESLHEMEMTIARLKAKVKEFTRDIEKKDAIIEARNLEIDNIRQQLSKQKGKGKTKKDFGQDYIKVQENNPEGTINGLQIDMNDTQTHANDNQANYNEYAQSTDTANTFEQPNYNGYDQAPEYYEQSYENTEQQPQGFDENAQNYEANYNGDFAETQDQYQDANATNNVENAQNGEFDNGQFATNYDENANYQPVQGAYDNTQFADAQQGYEQYDNQNADNQFYPENTDNGNATFDNQTEFYPQEQEGVNVENIDYQAPIENVDNFDNAQNAPQETVTEIPAQPAQDTNIETSAQAEETTVAPETETTSQEPAVETENQDNKVDLETPVTPTDEPITFEVTEDKPSDVVEENAQEQPQTETPLDTETPQEAESKTIVKKQEQELKPAKKPKVKKLTDEISEDKKEEVKQEEKVEKPQSDEATIDIDLGGEEEKSKTKETKKSTDKKDDEIIIDADNKADNKEEKAEKPVDKKDNQEETDKKKYVENDDLVALQKQIEEENARLKQQQEELRAQIDKTLATMEKASNATKAERTRNIKKIRDLIAKLKTQAEDAKARGASKSEINKINKSVAELLKVIADYQAKK